ncbi:hypothetical protein GCM10028773_33940 [Spirosoma koreense]
MDKDHQVLTGPPSKGTLLDMGEMPVPVKGHAEFTQNEFQTAAYSDNFVVVATSNGLWRCNLLTKEWSRSGFAGRKVSCIYKHPTLKNKFFAGVIPAEQSSEKSLFISEDGGQSWTAATTPIHDDGENRYETYVSIAVRPSHPDQVYANLEGGAMIAVSTDGGQSWQRMNYEPHSNFGYQSNIVFLPDNPDQLFQGSENPFDDAWLGRYTIDPTDPVKLTQFTKVVDMSVFGNRRPVELQTTVYTGNSIYVGQEGALAKVTGTTTQFIFKAEENKPALPYAYIYGIWIDPKDTRHLLFGGAVNGDQTALSLFETLDEGITIRQLNDIPSLASAQVVKIVTTDTDPAIVLYDTATKKIRLFLYKST